MTTGGGTFNTVIDEILGSGDTDARRTLPFDGLFKWRVGAIDVHGNEIASADLEVRNFTIDTTPPGAPILLSPVEITNDGTPLFDWDVPTVNGVFDYRLQAVTFLAPFAEPFVIDTPGITQTEFQSTVPLLNGEYQWRVIARDVALNTAFSATQIFVVDTLPPSPAPTLVLPGSGDSIDTATPFFEWTPSGAGVFDYLLQVTSGDTFNAYADIETFISHPGTGLQSTILLADAAYIWRVIATDTASNTASSAIRGFTVDTVPPDAPTLVSPIRPIADDTPFFDWDGNPGDDSGYLLLVTSGDIDLALFNLFGGSQGDPSQFDPSQFITGGGTPGFDIFQPITGDPPDSFFLVPPVDALSDAAYSWRVIAADRALNTASSTTSTFRVDTQTDIPVLVAPIGIIGTQEPRFSWDHTDPSPPVTYKLRVTTGDIGSGPFVINSNTNDLFFDAPIDLPIDPVQKLQTYTWSVRATDSLGNQSAPSTADFTINLNTPVIELLSPLGIVTVGVDTFQWKTTGNIEAVSYHLQIDNAAGDYTLPLEDVIKPHVGLTGDVQVHTLLVPLGDGIYKWRVKGSSVFGITNGFVEAAFTVDVSPPVVPVLLAPLDGAITSNNTPTFDWSDVEDTSGVTYQLQVTSGDFAGGPFIIDTGGLTQSQLPVVQPLPDAQYLWRAQVEDGAGNLSGFTDSFSVRVDTIRLQRPPTSRN